MASANVPSPTLTSPQENDLLARSVKRIKETEDLLTSPSKEENMMDATATAPSYKDKLLIDGVADDQNIDLSFDAIPEYLDEESDIDDDPDDPAPIILFSREEKRRMRQPWKNAIIIKTFGKTVGYNFLYQSIKAQWKPTGMWDCIDLGYDYFLIRFQAQEDLNRVINGGPWFVGSSYLTIRPWEPNFKPENATFSHTVVWAQLPGLSAEYYDTSSLRRIGNSIGNLLRVDAHTAHHTRGQYARVCVRVDLDKPLIKLVRLGRIRQKVVYEGIRGLYFTCGRIGHHKDACPYKLSINRTEGVINAETQSQRAFNDISGTSVPVVDNSGNLGSDDSAKEIQIGESNQFGGRQLGPSSNRTVQSNDFGPWLIVERRKKKKIQKQAPELSPAGRNSSSNNQMVLAAPNPRKEIVSQQSQRAGKIEKSNGKAVGSFIVKSSFKPVAQTIKNTTVSSSGHNQSDNGPMCDSIPRRDSSKGKEAMCVIKAPSVSLGQASNQSNVELVADGAEESKTGPLLEPTKLQSNLESALTTVKDRIKNLEQKSTTVKIGTNSTDSPKPSAKPIDDQAHVVATNSCAQSQPIDPTSLQQDSGHIGVSLDSDIVMERGTASTVEGGESISAVVPIGSESQSLQSSSYSKFNSSLDGKSDSFDRDVRQSKARVHFRRSRHRRESGPYPTSEALGSNMVGVPQSIRDEGQNRGEPGHRQNLNYARGTGGTN